ncbi:hypothetical protein KCU99_g1628, partial [Aureobasidium melanogenum]
MTSNLVLFTAPLKSDVVSPGFLVYDKANPQDHFNPSSNPLLKNESPRTSSSELQDIKDIQSLCRAHRLEVSLTDFLSTHLGLGSKRVHSVEATKGETILLVQADEWLRTICSVDDTRRWLEDRMQDGRKTYMVVGKVVLTDTKIGLSKQRDHSVGGGLQAPLLSITGVPLPTPLDPGFEASTSRESVHESSATLPGEIIFAILYRRIELAKRRRRAVPTNPQYNLRIKATWTSLWETRGAEDDDSDVQSLSGFSDDFDAEEEIEDNEEIVEAFLADEDDIAYSRLVQDTE